MVGDYQPDIVFKNLPNFFKARITVQNETDKSFTELHMNVAENSNTMLAYWDKDLICRYANSAYLYWFGIHPSRMIDKMHIKELLGPLYELNLPYITDALVGNGRSFDRYISLPDGSIRKIHATYIPQIVNREVTGFYVKVSGMEIITEKPIVNTLNVFDRKVNYLPAINDNLEAVVESLKSCIFYGFPGIELLAKKHYISESKLKRDFKERFGETIFMYYRNLQMELAYEYITSKKVNKSQMAHMLNFSNPSNFSTCYRTYIDGRLAKQVTNKIDNEKGEIYRVIIEQTPFPIAVLDNDLRFLMASEKFIARHQLYGKDYIGKHLYDVWPESKELYQKKLEKCLVGEIDRSDDGWLKKANGTPVRKRWDIRPWYSIGNTVGGVFLYSEKIATDEFKEQDYKKMSAVLDTAHKIARFGIWERDFKNNTNTWSTVLKDILEVSADFDPSLEDTLAFYKDNATRDMIIKLREGAMENGTQFDIEVDMVTAKGNPIRVRAIGYPDMVNGKCEKVCGIFQDITKSSKED